MIDNEVMVKWADAVKLANEIRAERDAAYKLLRDLHRNFEGVNGATPANVTSFKAETAYGLIDQFLAEVDRRNAESAAE